MPEASYRKIAEDNLNAATTELNSSPDSGEHVTLAQARATRAQAIATVATAQALLYIGDVLAGRDTHYEH